MTNQPIARIGLQRVDYYPPIDNSLPISDLCLIALLLFVTIVMGWKAGAE